MDEYCLAIDDLSYEHNGRTVLRDINLTIAAGETVGLYDPTGVSYRALLKICATLLQPTKGKVALEGIPIPYGNEMALFPLRRSIAYISSDTALISNLTLLQNVSLGWAYYENKLLEDCWEEGDKLFSFFHIEGYKHLRPTAVDAEIYKRTVCIRELAKKPGLILLGTVIESLSTEGQNLFLSYVKDHMRREKCAMFIASTGTGFLTRCSELITRSYLLTNGTLNECGLRNAECEIENGGRKEQVPPAPIGDGD